ncbi:hypothetical protein CPB85DRAFT_1551514 [Mucidula mucida]|nr:hypothetical protein CPB85DRAFT_1551514 [Mucidula mucida]
MALPEIGTRISLAGHIGTVRFTGSVDGTTGVWLGVEWDDPQRGKHSGIKDGKQYFSCRIPHAGSFIRPSVHVSYGVSFLEALHAKYIELPHGSQAIEKIVLGSSHGAIQVEAANLDKIRQKFSNLAKLRVISLDAQLVSRPDEPGAITSTCPNVRGLNLSMSLLPSWEAVASITSELVMLDNVARLSSAFLKLTVLQLNKTLTSWSEMERIIAFMPQIQVVELGYNGLDHLASDDIPCANASPLETLNLDSNQLGDWVHILQSLQPYIALTRVILSSNDIQAIPYPTTDQRPMSVIKSVSLSSNKLHSWSAIDALHRWFPSLEALYVRDNPLFDEQASELARYARQLIIAKIPSLKTLDATSISTRERTDCELFYLSHIAKKDTGSDEERCQSHPQWLVLRKKHGMLEDPDAQRPLSLDRLKNRLIELNAYHRLSLSDGVKDVLATPPMKIRVLPSMQLHILRQKLRKLTKSKANLADITVWALMDGDHLAELTSDRDKQDIAWLGLDQDSSIIFLTKE